MSLASRFVRKQIGFARARASRFKAHELRGTPEQLWTNESVDSAFADSDFLDEDGTAMADAGPPHLSEDYRHLVGKVRTPAGPLAGIKKLLKAYEASLGRIPADRKKELRDEFYKGPGRRRGQSVIDYITYYRNLLAKMEEEKIVVDEEEQVYCLRDQLHLTEQQNQLLEIQLMTLGAPESCQLIELEIAATRLFKRVHQSERAATASTSASGSRPPMLRRFLQRSAPSGARPPTSMGTASSSASTRSGGSFRSAQSQSSRGKPKQRLLK